METNRLERTGWEILCKRTEDPKLAWIERELDKLSIPHRRNGRSWHADHILEVPEVHSEAANAILMRKVGRWTIDDIRDDHPRWNRDLKRIRYEEEGELIREAWER